MKTYKSIENQIMYLRETKKITCGPNSPLILENIGYFNLINGYKTPFVQNKDRDGNHIYIPNTNIDALHKLYQFDRDLRMNMFYYITLVEDNIRAIFSNLFSSYLDAKDKKWDDSTLYCRNIDNFINNVKTALKDSKNQYVIHYRNKVDDIGDIPLWIVFKAIRFYDLIKFLAECPIQISKEIATRYGVTSNKNYSQKELRATLDWLRMVRNASAHGERTYFLKKEHPPNKLDILEEFPKSYKKMKNYSIFHSVIYLKYFLTPEKHNEMLTKFEKDVKILKEYMLKNILEPTFEKIRADLGLKKLEDISILRNISI